MFIDILGKIINLNSVTYIEIHNSFSLVKKKFDVVFYFSCGKSLCISVPSKESEYKSDESMIADMILIGDKVRKALSNSVGLLAIPEDVINV